MAIAVGGWVDKSKTFLREVRVEMSKVTWPTRHELQGQTRVVIVAVLLIALFIGIVDWVLSNTVRYLITRLS